jgi:hypothetical protein
MLCIPYRMLRRTGGDRCGSRGGMSNTRSLVAAAAGVPQRADPLPLAPTMAVAGHQRTHALQQKRPRGPFRQLAKLM